MAIIGSAPGRDASLESVDPGELLIKEARRKARRRRLVTAATAVTALLVTVALVVELSGGSTKARQPQSVGSNDAGVTPAIPVGPYASLAVAGSVAVSPSGKLYVVDVARDRVLVRLSNGRFRVVAGDGRVGFAGDGGPAYKAELSKISQIAFGPGGNLYIVDGTRVRVVNAQGVIHTVAGDGGGSRPHFLTSITSALSDSLGSQLSMAIGVHGQIYISTGWQVLKLTSSGRLDLLPITARSGPPHSGGLRVPPDPLGTGEIAVSARGTVDLSGVTGWAIWQVTHRDVAFYVANARQSGGDYSILQRGPGGAVYAATGSGIVKVEQKRLASVFEFDKVRGEYFSLTNFAFGPHGSIYADDIPGNSGFEAHQQLVSVIGTRIYLLWQQKNVVSR
ncbi:MAG: hypothetical protein WA860_12485 [Acidimicrobiales bacterium]